MNVAELGSRIRSRREILHLTQAQLANSLHISAQAVSKWERGENAPDISILKPLSTILSRSIEWILTGNDAVENTFDATIFCTSVRTFASRSSETTPENIALWMNGLFHAMTEAVLAYDGVPVKYTGDGFLAYFSGTNHSNRAMQSALLSGEAVQEKDLLITLHSGPVYLGTIGHHEYASLDILGESVNSTFMLNRWATENTKERLVVTNAVAVDTSTLENMVHHKDASSIGLDTVIEVSI